MIQLLKAKDEKDFMDYAIKREPTLKLDTREKRMEIMS